MLDLLNFIGIIPPTAWRLYGFLSKVNFTDKSHCIPKNNVLKEVFKNISNFYKHNDEKIERFSHNGNKFRDCLQTGTEKIKKYLAEHTEIDNRAGCGAD